MTYWNLPAASGSARSLPIRPGNSRTEPERSAPEHRRLSRYSTLSMEDIITLPVDRITTETAHLYL